MSSEQLQLRREVTREDMEKLREWMRDERITDHLNEDQDIGETLARVIEESPLPIFTPRLNSDGRFFLLTLPGEGPVGFLRLAARPKTAEMVVVIGKPHLWGRGYGLEAVRKGLHHAFFTWRKERVVAKIKKSNRRSRRLFRRAGFTKDRDLEEEEKLSIALEDVLTRECPERVGGTH